MQFIAKRVFDPASKRNLYHVLDEQGVPVNAFHNQQQAERHCRTLNVVAAAKTLTEELHRRRPRRIA